MTLPIRQSLWPLKRLCLSVRRLPPEIAGGLRASLRAPLRWPGVRPSEHCLPRPKVRSHTRRPLALPTVFLRKAAQGHRFLASAGSIRRTGSACRSERSFFGPCPETSVAPFEGCRGAEALHTSKTIYGLPTSRSRPALPSEQWRPERGTIAATRTGRPTQPLQRTPEAFSTVVVCEGRRLRGTAVAFKRRTLNGNTLAGLNFFC